MSSYRRVTKHPVTGEWENAWWIDDFFGPHKYGVRFDSTPETTYDPDAHSFITDRGAAICAGCGKKYTKRGITRHQNKCPRIQAVKSIKSSFDKALAKTSDPTNPGHYKSGGMECIELIKNSMSQEAFEGFLRGNILKYTYRYKNKNGVEDLKKAKWYLNYLTDTLS